MNSINDLTYLFLCCSIKVNLMTPVKPMLAEACKSAEQAFGKCKNGILAEVKYDGERLQVHKNGEKFVYFSRNLKQVSEHKTAPIKEYIPKAMPNAKSLILDGEILLYDTKNKCPLPFGTLGKHKKNKFQDATVCYFVFDCLYYNGESLMNKYERCILVFLFRHNLFLICLDLLKNYF